MKDAFFCFLLVLAAGACPGAADDALLSFSTRGPDTYGDGTAVLDGERYALVWTRDGAAFAGLAADGGSRSEATRVVAVAPLAKGGRCPETVFEIDAAYAETFAGGTFALYLLDTRVRAADGTVGLAAADRRGRPRAVNAAGASSAAVPSDSRVASLGSAGAVSLAEVGVYAEIDEPEITAVEVRGAEVALRIARESPLADYFVLQGGSPGRLVTRLKTSVSGDTLTVERPGGGGAAFFRVVAARKFK